MSSFNNMKYFLQSLGLSFAAALIVFLLEAVLLISIGSDVDNNTFDFVTTIGALLLFAPYIYTRWHIPNFKILGIHDKLAIYCGVFISTGLLVFGSWIHLVMWSIAKNGLGW